MYKPSIIKSIIAGMLATAAMTLFATGAPLMGMPEMNVPKMLAGTMGTPTIIGWAAHFMIGIILALGFAVIFYSKLPGSGVVKGLIFSLIPWLMAQLIVMPMMAFLNSMPFSSGIFSGSIVMAMGSMLGHLVYGLVLGLTYKPVSVELDVKHSFTNA